MNAKLKADLCKNCLYYRDGPSRFQCYTDREPIPTYWTKCVDYAPLDPSEDVVTPDEKEAPTHIKIEIGSKDWLNLHRGVWALHKIRHLTSKTAVHLLKLMEPDAKGCEKRVEEWEERRCGFRVNAIHTPQDFCVQKHWREALDALREQFMSGEIDTDIVLAALDPQDTGSESVKDLIHSWEIEFWSSVADADGLAVAREMSGNPDIPF